MLRTSSPSAYIYSLGNEYRQVHAAFVGAVLAFLAVVIVHRVRPGIGHWVANPTVGADRARRRSQRAHSYGRTGYGPTPRDLPVPLPHAQITAAVRAAMTNWHWSRSLQWFGSYLGVIAVVIAFVGFIILGWHAARQRCRRRYRARCAPGRHALHPAPQHQHRPAVGDAALLARLHSRHRDPRSRSYFAAAWTEALRVGSHIAATSSRWRV